jgi:hypothetical protein
MFYAMMITDGVATRIGPKTRNIETAKRWATRYNGYVEQYGHGVVWLPARRMERLHQLKPH